MRFRAHLDHMIRLRLADLPGPMRDDICEALTIPNVAKEDAKKNGVWGWQNMDDEIELWAIDGDDLVVPRGFAHNLVEGVEAAGYEVVWEDQRQWRAQFRLGAKGTPRPHQIPAIDAILENEQGIYKAPAGSGKTVTVLFAIRKAACKSLIIVNTKDILWQWQNRVATFLGDHYPCGQIGDGKVEISPYITIATAQTIHSRYEELEALGFFDEFSFVCLDECHHATADTYNYILNRFSARYRIGVSATPDKTGDFKLATNVLGPIFYETRPKELQGHGILIQPEIIRVNTGWQFGFKGARGIGRRSNYGELVQKLVTDPERNAIIVKAIMREQGHHGLCITKRIEHIDILESMLLDAGYRDPILRLTGKDKNSHREYVVKFAAEQPCLVLSTLADEALDIPRLDRGFLAFPQRNTGLVTQQVGRFERDHPDKQDAIIYDFVDGKVGPLKSQWSGRRFEVYEPRGYKITRMKGDEL